MMVDGRLMGSLSVLARLRGSLSCSDGSGNNKSTVPAFFKTSVIVLFGGIVTSKAPFRAVAVWGNTSLLINSMVSPTVAEVSAGEITRSSIVIRMVAAPAGTDAPSGSAATIERGHLGVMSGSLLQGSGEVFGVLRVALKDLQAGLQ